MRNLNVVAVGVVLATAIAVGPSAWAQTCGGKPETQKLVLMADWIPVTVSQGAFWSAKLNGYYKDEGLDVDIIAPANPADPIKLVARERVTFSLTYVPEVMISRDTSIPVVAVATTLRKLVSGFMSLKESNIKVPADLKGKIVGTGAKLDAQAFLDTMLATGGITRKDVQIVDPGFAHIPLTLEKKVHVAHALTYFEVAIGDMMLKKQGKDALNFMPYTDFGVPQFYYQLVVGNENWLRKNPNAACAFLKASMKGLDAWRADGKNVLEHVVKANNVFTREEHEVGDKVAKPDWSGAKGEVFAQDVAPWKTAQDWAMKYKLISVGGNPAEYFTNRYLPKK
ncbi:MAG: ABC transporter substrate-binding protein [Alphaproteobacteria bacterium]|nr:ABC transporter substrate-binding protein [Alphaproteobacteria bacterium]